MIFVLFTLLVFGRAHSEEALVFRAIGVGEGGIRINANSDKYLKLLNKKTQSEYDDVHHTHSKNVQYDKESKYPGFYEVKVVVDDKKYEKEMFDKYIRNNKKYYEDTGLIPGAKMPFLTLNTEKTGVRILKKIDLKYSTREFYFYDVQADIETALDSGEGTYPDKVSGRGLALVGTKYEFNSDGVESQVLRAQVKKKYNISKIKHQYFSVETILATHDLPHRIKFSDKEYRIPVYKAGGFKGKKIFYGKFLKGQNRFFVYVPSMTGFECDSLYSYDIDKEKSRKEKLNCHVFE